VTWDNRERKRGLIAYHKVTATVGSHILVWGMSTYIVWGGRHSGSSSQVVSAALGTCAG
jgi:hypothetical protein